jgi:hypothetical protein
MTHSLIGITIGFRSATPFLSGGFALLVKVIGWNVGVVVAAAWDVAGDVTVMVVAGLLQPAKIRIAMVSRIQAGLFIFISILYTLSLGALSKKRH